MINSFNNLLLANRISVPPKLWECLDEHIDLKDCEVYYHSPPESFLDDEPGTLWSYMWFFFNKKKKRVAYLNLSAVHHHKRRRSVAQDSDNVRGSFTLRSDDGSSFKHKRSNSTSLNPIYAKEEEYDLTRNISDSELDEENVVGDLELE